MAVQKRPSLVVSEEAVDLDATAELPAVDFTIEDSLPLPVLPESQVATDVYPAPVIQVGAADLADSLREVELRLQRKIERVGELERLLADAETQRAVVERRLADNDRSRSGRESGLQDELDAARARQAELERDLGSTRDALAEARGQLQAQRDALGESQQAAERRAATQRHHEQDLAELRRRSERQLEALSSLQGQRTVNEAMLGELEAAVRGAEGRHAAALVELQSARSQSEAAWHAERAQLMTRFDALEASLRDMQQQLAERDAELAALREGEDRAREGGGQFDALQTHVTTLEAELAGTRQRLTETEAQARQANDRVRRLEADAHASAALLGNLQQNMARLGKEDSGSRPVLQPPPLPTQVRALVRQDEGGEVVYPLAKRTTVGRTPDNDIQVDTTFVSRHHAVLLSNTDHCIVEDLNSTNGVLVNGRRVGRQILHDGDMVTVGRTEFRYQQRS